MSYRAWRTADELRFIDSIGRHCGPHEQETAELLRGYVEGCRKRVAWDHIDRATVIARAKALLREMV